ncbi:MAG: ModE family transcriptional regulator, partial [Oscillibacter sp.]
MKENLHLKLTVRLYTDDHERCFGPGIATLLSRVREHHSLRAAAASMEMAYSKAWRILRTAEEV